MYLKRIEIQGFKSFADKTTIEFTNEITAIVGPNGSGKSNISDAIRWVLGEQSIRYLRGNKMEDVIFSGTDKRKPLGYAEVNIIFDNKDHVLPIDFSEVSIKRRIFRSGESEYYINNTQCRLKDIRLLIMDTGIGKEGYSIIGQGRIDEILSNRPEERRNIFEEAAGIVKYKTKKAEAERRLKNTEDNLIRINDLISEITNQYNKLEIESEKASKFTRFFEELKELEISLFVQEANKTKLTIKELALKLNELDDNIAIQEEIKKELIKSSQVLQLELDSSENKIEDLRKRKLELYTLNENTNNKIALLNEKRNFSKRDLNRLKDEKERINFLILEKTEELFILNKQNLSIKKDLEVIIENHSKMESDLIDIENRLNLNLFDLETNKNKVNDVSNEVLIIKNRLSNNKERVNIIHNNIIKLNPELKNIEGEISSIGLIIGNLNKTNIKLASEQKQNKELLDDLNNTKNILVSNKDNINDEIKSIEIVLEGLNSSLNLYNSMEKSYEGYYKSVKNLIKIVKRNDKLKKGFIGPVADLITVEDIYEKAIDIGLGSSIQNIVVEKDTNAKDLINHLKDNNLGRVTFLPLNTVVGSTLEFDRNLFDKYGILGIGNELIKYDARYDNVFKFLLGRIFIIDNIENAIKMSKKYRYRYKLITLDGEIINPGGSFTGGSYKHNNISILNRKKHIKKIEDDIKKKLDLLSMLKEDQDEIKNKLRIIENKINKTTNSIRNSELEKINLTNKINLHLLEQEKFNQKYFNIVDNIKSLELELESNQIKIDADEQNLNVYTSDRDNLANNIDKSNEDYNETLNLRDSFLKTITDLKIEINLKENQFANIQTEYLRVSKEKIDLEASYLKVLNSISKLNEENEHGEKELEELLQLIKELKIEQADNELDLETFVNNRLKLRESFRKEQEDLQVINNSISKLEKNRNSNDLKISKLNIQVDNIIDNLREIYEISFTESLNYVIEILDINKSKTRVGELKKIIRDLGNINISSIEDFKDVKDRLEFLNNQNDDLFKGKEDLKSIIKDIEIEMKKIFLKEFEKINKNFSEVFSILFNGGKASLIFDDDADILNTGIEIQAQPPGKRLQNINLLSGGEKSLTAVAILFAILQTKPSPFCVLDEIDASLDETNISRYTEYLREFKEETQFVLITHRKTTMEIANVLYGVTMENEGVSKLISVKLKDYIEGTAS